nr:retrovirus-related Pol polyprotein from transposon TNT 1-94 [Tanacetum cinerariifolium]
MSDKHVVMTVIDDEETLILEEKSRSKMSEKAKDPEIIDKNISHKPIDYEKLNRLSKDFWKRFTLQQEMDVEQAFWFRISNPTSKPSDASPVTIKAPKELPKVILVNESLKKLKFYLGKFDNVMKIRTTLDAHTEGMLKLDLEPLAPRLLQNREIHLEYLKNTQVQANILWRIVEQAKAKQPLDNVLDFACSSKKSKSVESKNANHSKPNHTWGSNATDIPSSASLIMTVRFRNDHIARIMRYGDYQLGNVTISRVYYVEGLGHNLIYVGQFCDTDLEVAFRKNTCFIRNLEGVDLDSGSRDINLYIISLDDLLKTSPICLLSKALKTKSWLWHRRLSHLNFDTLNKLAKDSFARAIPRLRFQKDHLCSACALGKSKKSSHKPKAEDTNQEKLYLLHMDLCGPMRMVSINGKRYILVIVDDYSRFTWVRFLRSKDEAHKAIIKCIKNIQVCLNATVRNVQTDNGTKFVNQTLCAFYENVCISHQTSVARTP